MVRFAPLIEMIGAIEFSLSTDNCHEKLPLLPKESVIEEFNQTWPCTRLDGVTLTLLETDDPE